MVVDDKKRCPKCDTYKSTQLFYKSKTNRDGCSSYCKRCQNLRTTSYARDNKEKIPTTGYALKRRYGITSEDYQAMMEKQNYACAICGVYECDTGRNFAVDHCHDTKSVRGLLCSKCNTGLGMFKDNPETIRRAIDYLARSSKKP